MEHHTSCNRNLNIKAIQNVLYDSCLIWASRFIRNKMYDLGSISCHVLVCHVFLMKYICSLFLMQLLVIVNITLKQLIIREHHIGVYHKRGSIANGRTSIFDGSQNYVKKVVSERI